jgi:hypothetical protein
VAVVQVLNPRKPCRAYGHLCGCPVQALDLPQLWRFRRVR